MAGLLYDDMPFGVFHFVLLTLIMGIAGGIASGRAIASSWKSFAIVPFYMAVLAAALRFLNYALFAGDLLSLPGYIIAFVVTLAAAAYGYRSKRALQMATQYSWLYSRSGPIGWTPKPS